VRTLLIVRVRPGAVKMVDIMGGTRSSPAALAG
jgi:hypothetical protein